MKEDVDFMEVIRYYVHRVIGLDVPLADSPRPAFAYEPEREMHLPMTHWSLSEFLGEVFVKKAPEELVFSILLGLAYHEAGHALSGEDNNTKPHVLNNIICDANDISFVPKRFPGSIPFTLTLFDVSLKSCEDIAKLELSSKKEQLIALLNIAVMYMRHLKFPFDNKLVRNLPDDHQLKNRFDKLVPILRQARKAKITERPELVREFYEIIKDLWDDNIEPQIYTLILKPLSGGDAGKMTQAAAAKGVLKSAGRELKRIKKAIEENPHWHEPKGDEVIAVTEMSA
ncbi:hypothetical protein DRQ36_11040, partial [bacterium]